MERGAPRARLIDYRIDVKDRKKSFYFDFFSIRHATLASIYLQLLAPLVPLREADVYSLVPLVPLREAEIESDSNFLSCTCPLEATSSPRALQ